MFFRRMVRTIFSPFFLRHKIENVFRHHYVYIIFFSPCFFLLYFELLLPVESLLQHSITGETYNGLCCQLTA